MRARHVSTSEWLAIQGIKAELEATKTALTQAQAERDEAVREAATLRGQVSGLIHARDSLNMHLSDTRGQRDALDASLVQCQAQLATAQANCDALIGALRQVEWSMDTCGDRFCPACEMRPTSGHAEGCALDDALRTPTTTPDSATPLAQEEI